MMDVTYNSDIVEELAYVIDRRLVTQDHPRKEKLVALRWFNLIGFAMLFLALFFNEVVYLNVWYDFNFYTVFPAIAYMVLAIWLSLWPGTSQEPAH